MSEQCVVLVTHQLQYVQQCDTVLVLKEVSHTVVQWPLVICCVPCVLQGKQFLCGDTSTVLGDRIDILELIGEEKEDPRGQFDVIKQDDGEAEGLRSRGK